MIDSLLGICPVTSCRAALESRANKQSTIRKISCYGRIQEPLLSLMPPPPGLLKLCRVWEDRR